MADASEPGTLFPKIGQVVDDTSNQPETGEYTDKNQTGEDDDERAVQEIDSLCMKCFKQVRRRDCPH